MNDMTDKVSDLAEKAKHKGQEVGGDIKEKAGQASDDPQLEAEGRRDQTAGNVKQAGDNIKDAAKDAFGN
jgi:uncharacterized protein YjbJ (UPF0337 family)